MNTAHLKSLLDRLVEPYQPIADEDQADRARLLAGLSLTALLISLILPTLYTINSGEGASPLQWIAIVVSMMAIGGLYHFARKGHTQAPSVAIIVFAIIILFAAPGYSAPPIDLLSLYHVVGIILFAAMFLSFQFTLALSILVVLGMLALPLVYPRLSLFDVASGPAGFTFFMSFIIVFYIRYRLQADERRRKHLSESEERYRRISEVTSDYAFSYRLDPGGSMVKEWSTDPLPGVPENISLILNSSTEKVSLLDAEDSVVLPSSVTTLLGGKSGERDYRLREANGQDHWVRVYRYPVWSDDEKRITHIYGAVKDVTERRLAETARRQLKLQQERLTVVNQLTEAISHDFRTSLASIVTNRYLLERKLDSDEEAQKRLGIIQKMVDHMTQQLDKFKHLASLVQPRLLPTDVNQILSALAEKYSKQANQTGLQLTFEGEVDLPVVQVDSAEIERAISYLLDNALSFTPSGGSIHLKTSSDADNIQIQVQDTGPGIPSEAQLHIYDFFYRADPARSTESGGIGMGLSLVKMVAEAHGGRIQVTSEVGVGSTFTLTLPIGNTDSEPNEPYIESMAAD